MSNTLQPFCVFAIVWLNQPVHTYVDMYVCKVKETELNWEGL